MMFDPNIKSGDTISNEELVNIFKVGNMGGMRRSTKNGTLVIISDHTKGMYDDKWYGNELHYTGMGKTGDQDIKKNQNKTLAESNKNGVVIHLFEVFESGKYNYRGVAHLIGDTYQEMQKDVEGNLRKVWMFPLSIEETGATVDEGLLGTLEESQGKKVERLPTDELYGIAKFHSSNKASFRETTSTTYVRDTYVKEYTKRRSNGYCELCGEPAPFQDKNGNFYLESHHIVWLSKGGADSIDNTVALCPNCHRKMHVVDDPNDVLFLKNKRNSTGKAN